MKLRLISTALLLSAVSIVHAQDKDFAQYLRTRDSLMHIAYYDNDLKTYNKNFTEVLVRYSELAAKEKNEHKDYIDEEYYYLASLYAQAGDKAGAMNNLEKSNFMDYEELLGNRTLNVLHNDPRFMKYLAKAKAKKHPRLLLLQKDAKYNLNEKTYLPSFTYQPASDPDLVKLRMKYNLDSVAGEGNDVSRIINLMKWVHYLIPHDGSKGNPATRNALSMIKECRRDNKTLNCRGLAIVLNEVYLAAGFKSRFVTCMPKDSVFDDCHVINVVWSTSLNKWLWMDPTFMAYVMNEEGTPLSIEEVRDRLVHDKPLVLNPDANRNHATSQTLRDYLGYYMAKNLYRMECPAYSVYNYETFSEKRSRIAMQLVPGTQIPAPKIRQDKDGMDLNTVYYTNDPARFWAKPEGVDLAGDAALPKGKDAHTQADYEDWMKKFKDVFNANNGAGLRKISIPENADFFTDKMVAGMVDDYGKLVSYQFVGMEDDNKYQHVALFKVTCEKSTHCMGISLENMNKVGTFRFQTRSNYIDWAMAKAIDKEKASK